MIGLQLIPGYGRSLADICNSDLYAEGLQRILEVLRRFSQLALAVHIIGVVAFYVAATAADNGIRQALVAVAPHAFPVLSVS